MTVSHQVGQSFSMAFCRHVRTLGYLTLKICRKDIVDLHPVPDYLHVQLFTASTLLNYSFLLHIPLEQNSVLSVTIPLSFL